MPFGWDDAIMAAGALGSGALTLNGQQQQAGQAAGAMQLAQQNYLLQKQQMQQQYELSTAGQTDARGNYTHYIPGRGWVTDVTPTTRGLITSSDANTRENNVTQLTRGSMERQQAFGRRQEEGGIAKSLLDQYKNGYGKPTAEGVQGAQRLAGVTGANETADNIKSGMASAALRSGGSTVPLAANFASANRGAVSGTRSAIARADADSPSIYQSQLQNYTKGATEPYNLMATRASNSNDVPFAPENVSAGIDAGRGTAATAGQSTVSRAMGGPAAGINSILEANKQNYLMQPNYGTFAGGATDILTSLLKKYMGGGGGGGSSTPYTGESKSLGDSMGGIW